MASPPPPPDAPSAIPDRTEQGLAEMTAETSRMAGGRGRPPSGPAERPPAQRLLTAAEELFGERSYHRTTVADICARARMATGSFYSYYESKAEIFAAVVRAINTDLRTGDEGGARARRRRAAERGNARPSGPTSTCCPRGRGSTASSASRSSSTPGCSGSTTSTWPAGTHAACGPPSWTARSTRATTPRSSRTSTPASATSSACAGRSGPRAAGSPRTCSTTCSRCWAAGWPRRPSRSRNPSQSRGPSRSRPRTR